MRRTLGRFCKFFLLLFSSTVLPAQQSFAPPNIFQLTRKAGYMFSGTVVSVERISAPKTQSAEAVRVTFHIDQGIRGVKTGQTLEIREWAGLWNGRERYRPGEHVFLFLHAPSRLGLTSPIGGDSGKLAIDPSNRVTVPGNIAQGLSFPGQASETQQSRRIPLRDFAAAVRRASEE